MKYFFLVVTLVCGLAILNGCGGGEDANNPSVFSVKSKELCKGVPCIQIEGGVKAGYKKVSAKEYRAGMLPIVQGK